MRHNRVARTERTLRAHVFDDPAALVRTARKSRATIVELTFAPSQEAWFHRRRALLNVIRRRGTVVPVVIDEGPGCRAMNAPALGIGPVFSARWSGRPASLDVAILRRLADALELTRAHGVDRYEAAAVVRRIQGRYPRSFLKANQWLEEAALGMVADALRRECDVRLFLGARALVQGRVNELDVLVQRGSRAVVIECKAFRSPSGGLVTFASKLDRLRVQPTAVDLAQHTARVVRVVGFIPALRARCGRHVSPLVRDGFEPHATLAADEEELAHAVRSALSAGSASVSDDDQLFPEHTSFLGP